MPGKRPATIAEYIQAAAPVAQPHLRSVHAILARVAPDAEQVIKWGNPFFVEPRFLFAFSAHKSHLSFTPMPSGLEPFRRELAKHDPRRDPRVGQLANDGDPKSSSAEQVDRTRSGHAD